MAMSIMKKRNGSSTAPNRLLSITKINEAVVIFEKAECLKSDQDKTLLIDYLKSHMPADKSASNNDLWIQQIYSDSLLTSLMYETAVQSLSFDEGVAVARYSFSHELMAEISNWKENKEGYVFKGRHKRYLKRLIRNSSSKSSTVLMGVCQNYHWGMIVMELNFIDNRCTRTKEDSRGNFTVRWGDGLRLSPTTEFRKDMVVFLESLLHSFYPNLHLRKRFANHMVGYGSVLNFSKQQDCYSCGFYVIASMLNYCQSEKQRHGFSDIGPYQYYSPRLTNAYRNAVIRSMFSAFKCVLEDISQVKLCTENRFHQWVSQNWKFPNLFPVQVDGAVFDLTDAASDGCSGIPKIMQCGDSNDIIDLVDIPFTPNQKCSQTENASFALSADECDLQGRKSILTKSSPGADNSVQAQQNSVSVVNSEPSDNNICGETNSADGKARKKIDVVLCYTSDIAYYAASFVTQGYCFNVNYARPNRKRRPTHDFSVRFRCSRQAHPTIGRDRCPAAFICYRLKNSGGTWEVKGFLEHNHPADIGPKCTFQSYMDNLYSDNRLMSLLPPRDPVSTSHNPDFSGVHVPKRSRLPSIAPRISNSEPDLRSCETVERQAEPVMLDREVVGHECIVDLSDEVEVRSDPPTSNVLSSDEAGDGRVFNDHVVEDDRAQSHCIAQNSATQATNNKRITVSPCDSSPSADLKTAVYCYVRSLASNIAGREVREAIQFICESFGLEMSVTRSRYINSSKLKGDERIFQSCVFQCSKVKKGVACPFKIELKTVRVVEDVEDSSGQCEKRITAYHYRVHFSEASHSHPPAKSLLLKRLPPHVFKEAHEMRNQCHIDFADVVRFLEERYGFKCDGEAINKKLRRYSMRGFSRSDDANQLVSNIVNMQIGERGGYSQMKVSSGNRLDAIVWAYPEWLEAYRMFGIIPGVSVDCKAKGNEYNMSLITINGRNNAGHVFTAFMGFINRENGESFEWVLRQFGRAISVPPAMIAMDQNAANMRACRKVFPSTYVTLDEWHLNQNQRKNVGAYLSSISKIHLYDEMATDLFIMRRSSTSQKFLRRRAAFESKYFTSYSQSLPKWYRVLYHVEAKSLIDCYNKEACDPRFLFQGSGYTEAANSDYRRVIVLKKVHMYEVPKEMRRITARRDMHQIAQKLKRRSAVYIQKFTACNLGLDYGMAERFVSRFTKYCLDMFYEHSVITSGHCVVREATVQQRRVRSVNLNPPAGSQATFENRVRRVCVFKVVQNVSHTQRFPQLRIRPDSSPAEIERDSHNPTGVRGQASQATPTSGMTGTNIGNQRRADNSFIEAIASGALSRISDRREGDRMRTDMGGGPPAPLSSGDGEGAGTVLNSELNSEEHDIRNNNESDPLLPAQEFDSWLNSAHLGLALLDENGVELDAGETTTISNTLTYEVLLLRDGDTQRYSCTCKKSRSTGFPCQHIVRVAIVYHEYVNRFQELLEVVGYRVTIERFFHPYWSQEDTAWTYDMIISERQRIQEIWEERNGSNTEAGRVLTDYLNTRFRQNSNEETYDVTSMQDQDVAELAGQDLSPEERAELIRRARRANSRMTSWANISSICGKMLDRALELGQPMIENVIAYLEMGYRSVQNGESPMTLNPAATNRQLPSSSLDLNSASNMVIQNPRYGPPRWGRTSRLRGSLERGRRGPKRRRIESSGTVRPPALASQNLGASSTAAGTLRAHQRTHHLSQYSAQERGSDAQS